MSVPDNGAPRGDRAIRAEARPAMAGRIAVPVRYR
jgi:hypothetical protein